MTAVVGLTACGGDDNTGPGSPTYESIAASYAGVMAGTAEGVAMEGDFALTITQATSSLSGSYSLSGTLNDGVDVAAFQGTGVLTGTIEAGDNPSVSITFTPGGCPSYSAEFSGAYDSDNERLTLAGPVEFFSPGTCNVALSYSMTIVLNR
jgi:hypothetical protein